MKNVTAALTSTLLTNNALLCADLYTFYFPTGSAYWTSADTNILSGSTLFLSTGPSITRGATRVAGGLEVSTIELTMAPGSLTVWGLSATLAATKGAFDQLKVRVDRAYMTTWGSIPNGVVNIFEGYIDTVEPGNSEIKFTVKSQLYKLNERTPRRLTLLNCPYTVYDSNCGLAATSFRTIDTISSVGTNSFNISAVTANVVTGSRVQFPIGTLAQQNFTVVAISGTKLTVVPAFPALPSAGDPVYIFRGCDKTRNTCKNTFSNIARFGGFPDAPKPEGVLK